MSNYRFHPSRGIRKQGKPHSISVDFDDLDEEEYFSREEFCQAIASHVFELLNELDEGEEGNEEE